MTTGCRCGSTKTAVRAGTASTSWFAFVEGRAVRVRDRRQRWACRACGSTWSHEAVELEPGTSLARELADALWKDSLEHGYAEAAASSGVCERTARRVFELRLADMRERAAASRPVVLLGRLADAGHLRIGLAFDKAGRVVDAYEDIADPRLAQRLGALPENGIVVCDHRLVAAAERLAGGGAVVGIHPAAIEEVVLDLLPGCLDRFVESLAEDATSELLAARRLLEAEPYALSFHDAGELRALRSRSLHADAFVAARDAMSRTWRQSAPEKGAEVWRSWISGLGPRLREAFDPIVSWVARNAKRIFAASWSAVPTIAWRLARVHAPAALVYDGPARVVARTLAAARALHVEPSPAPAM